MLAAASIGAIWSSTSPDFGVNVSWGSYWRGVTGSKSVSDGVGLHPLGACGWLSGAASVSLGGRKREEEGSARGRILSLVPGIEQLSTCLTHTHAEQGSGLSNLT
jgi:hypothetical protein